MSDFHYSGAIGAMEKAPITTPVDDDEEGEEDLWHAEEFRGRVVKKFGELLIRSRPPTTHNALALEYIIYTKATTKREYVGMVGTLILYFLELEDKLKKQAAKPNNQDVSIENQDG